MSMDDHRISYWREALGDALDRDGAHHLNQALSEIPENVAVEIADTLATWADQESWSEPPHPTAAELEDARANEVKQRYQRRNDELEHEVDCFTNSVARRRNVDPSQVYIDNLGRVAIYPR